MRTVRRTLAAGLSLALLSLAACSSGGASVAGLGLAGRLVYAQGPEGLWQLDLESGEIQQLWDVPDGGQVTGVAVSPDGQDLALSYAPPRGGSPFFRSDLYLADGDGSDPTPLLEHRGLYETFDYPTWSPDGQWIYLSRNDVLIDEQQSVSAIVVKIVRVPLGGGEPEAVIENAEQPSFSADGSRIAFLRFNLETYTRGLWVADADGSNARELVPDTRFLDLTSPRLSPDGTSVAFAASGPPIGAPPVGRSLWDRLLGVEVAYAHGLPWDYWIVSTRGGEPTILSQWSTDGTVLDWSPDGQGMALMHLGGLFVARTGAEPVFLAETPNHGGVDWSEY
jgi:Tol biopolymer transport system component